MNDKRPWRLEADAGGVFLWIAFDERKNKNHLLKFTLTTFGKNVMINISNRYIERIYYMKCGDEIAGVHSSRHADGRNNERL